MLLQVQWLEFYLVSLFLFFVYSFSSLYFAEKTGMMMRYEFQRRDKKSKLWVKSFRIQKQIFIFLKQLLKENKLPMRVYSLIQGFLNRDQILIHLQVWTETELKQCKYLVLRYKFKHILLLLFVFQTKTKQAQIWVWH